MDLLVLLGVLLWSYCHVATGIDCSRFTFDDSLEDDSDYVDGSGGYNIGDDLRLMAYAKDEWNLKVMWNMSRYTASPEEWVYKVQFVVNSRYNTTFGWQRFSEAIDKSTNKNQVVFPLYNPGAVYNITLLAAGPNQCLQQRVILTNLPGLEDAVAHFQLKLNFYTFKSCNDKLMNGGKQKIRRNFSAQILEALGTKRLFGSDLKLSNYLFVETNFLCLQPKTGMLTGRIISTGEVNTTQLLKALQRWVKTRPTLKIRSDSVVVDHYCPVYYVPPSENYCLSAPLQQPSTDSPGVSGTNSSEPTSNGNVLVIVGAVVASCVSMVLVAIVCGILLYKKKREGGRFSRFQNFTFRSRASIERQLRISNILACDPSVEEDSSTSQSRPASTTSDCSASAHHTKTT